MWQYRITMYMMRNVPVWICMACMEQGDPHVEGLTCEALVGAAGDHVLWSAGVCQW